MDPAETGFRRILGLTDATALVAGAMIGSGIFLVSTDIALQVGAPGWLLVVWIATGLLTVAGSLCYGELGGLFPHAGGQYVYLREAWSPLAGFLYGWTLFGVIQSGSIAAVGMAFAKYLGVILPGVSSTAWIVHLGDLHLGSHVLPVGIHTVQAVAIAVIALLTAVNALGVRAGTWVQNLSTSAKVLGLLGIILAGLLLGRPDGALREITFWTAHGPTGSPLDARDLLLAVPVAMVGALFAADAWNNVTFVAGELKDPRRDLGRSLVLGSGLVVVLYLLVNLAYLNVLPMPDVAAAAEGRVAAAAMSRLSPFGGLAVAVVVMISTFGCLNAMILSTPRVLWAMARDGLFFRSAGVLAPRSRVPVRALWLQGAWSAVLTLTGTYTDLLDYVIFATLLFYVLTVLGLFALRRRLPHAHRPHRTWGYPWLPALYVLGASFVAVVLLLEKPLYTWPGLVIVATGVPVYLLWRRFGRSESA
ncbi:MAG: amino acid permease [Deltaproteobacteria bacterium]|nr:amino acid permease [Deltaproteobacteria bacterium]